MTARRISAQVMFRYFMISSPLKKWGESSSLPLTSDRLEGGRDGVAAIRLVAFATMALTAELRRLVGAGGAAGRVVRRTDEEHRGVVAAGQTAVGAVGNLDHVHYVLIVASGAHYGRRVVVGGQADEEAVVLNVLRGIRAVHGDHAIGFGAIPVVLSTAADRGIQAHGVLIEVIAGAVAVISQQGGDIVEGAIGGRQGLIDLVLHHGALRPVAIVAAQAGHQAKNVRRASHQAGRQRLGVSSAVGLTGDDGLAVEVTYVLSPQRIGAGEGIARLVSAVAPRAAMWSMAARAATAVIQVCTQDVGRRGLNLC